MNARNPHAGLPITDDDAAIAAALEDVSVPALMLSLVHLTGDPSYIRGAIKPRMLVLNEIQGFMPEEEQAEVRRLALEAIRAYRDAGCVLPEQPGPELLHEMMSWLACDEVPREYLPMLLEDMGLDGVDARRASESGDPAARAGFPVVVIGCGQSGLLAGIRLQEAGIPFTIVEKNAGVGGTWYENTYPGCRVDVGNHFYCYSFEPSDHWSEFFARQPELQAYFESVMNRRGITEHVRWGTEVVSAVWDEGSATWRVTVETDGARSVLTARAVISAVGLLNRPKLPDIEGMDDFAGPSFHSARWDHGVDYRGRRVVQIGAGASGFQIAPTIAPDVAHLTVFQRTAQWMFPNPNYHEKVGPGVRWALRHLPFYGRWYRFMIFWPGSDGALAGARIDPEWPHQDRAVSERNDLTRRWFTDWITAQVGDDPELLAKVLPDYPATGKRTLQDNGSWLRTLKRDNVDLVREGVARIEKDAVISTSGERYEADVIVYATGFHANRFLWPMHIVGRGGAVLGEQWGDTPTAYLGITVPNFPNFFCLYGPGTGLAHGGSLIFQSECQMRYVSACLDTLISGGHRSMEPTREAHDEYTARHQAEIKQMVWSSPAVEHSWFKNRNGDIYTASPWRLVDYRDWTKSPDPDSYTID
ncbi:flavin-containing monooxygenase [Embleya sp. NPDC050493]|uniref:flavin-containing monooxygenase n=1 Tax=Embleya sp. NPDC050493 TaxID=3363989 RepID=UPI0037955F26